jgi:hypothetical protein
MSENLLGTKRKRGQRTSNVEIPRRLLDHLTPAVLENPYSGESTVVHINAETKVHTLYDLLNTS